MPENLVDVSRIFHWPVEGLERGIPAEALERGDPVQGIPPSSTHPKLLGEQIDSNVPLAE